MKNKLFKVALPCLILTLLLPMSLFLFTAEPAEAGWGPRGDRSSPGTVTKTISIDVNPSGWGDFEVDGDAPCSYPSTFTFESGKYVYLEAVPASGYHFVGWSGDLTGNDNPTGIWATGNKTITAHFIPQQFASNDELLTIAIPEGTMVMDEEDELLSSLELVVDETPPMPPPMSGIVGLPYNLGPSGTTFNQLITITLSYDPADIPLRTGEEDLILAYYDEDAGEWVELSSVVDTANSTVTALVDHFTTFAIIAPILHAKINWVILGPIIAVFVFLVVFLRIRIPTKKTI